MDTVFQSISESRGTAAGAFIALTLALVYYLYRLALPHPIPGIPYIEEDGNRVFGSIPSIMSYVKEHGEYLPYLVGLNSKLHAPLIQFFGMPFTKPQLILCDFQESQDLLLRRTKEIDRAAAGIYAFRSAIPEHHIAMQSWDPRFKGNKELVRDTMSPKFLHEVSAPQIYAKCLTWIQLWSMKSKMADGRPFEAGGDLIDATMDMINSVAFGIEDDVSVMKRQIEYLLQHGKDEKLRLIGTHHSAVAFPSCPPLRDLEAMHSVAKFLGLMINAPFRAVTYWTTVLGSSKLRADFRTRDLFIRRNIANSLKRLESGDETHYSATDFIVQRELGLARKESRVPNFYSGRITDELFGYIVGGHETTTAALSWILKLLSDHQSTQSKLRDTILDHFSTARSEVRLPSVVEIVKSHIAFLDAVIEECLRYRTPTPMTQRQTFADMTLLGHHIPKGTSIIISSQGPSYRSDPILKPDDPRHSQGARARAGPGMKWNRGDADDFVPERWLHKDEKNGELVFNPQAGPFLTFGLGPRACFGKRLAYLKIKIVLILLLWKLKLKKLDPELSKYDSMEKVSVIPKTFYVGLEPI